MDPITAVGFAASILTFVDYAHKVVTGTIEVFRSGKTSKNVHVSEVILDLKDAAKDLGKVPLGRTEQQKALHQLSASCQELGEELTTILKKLSTSPGQSTWMSLRVALRSMRKEGKVAEIESTLDRYRSQVLLRLTQIVSDQQLQLQVELCEFRTQARNQGTKTLDELRSLRTDLLDAIESSIQDSRQLKQKAVENSNSNGTSFHSSCSISTSLDDQLARISELREALDQILAKRDTPTPEMRILQQLWFDDMYVREDNIHDAEGNTFEWILDDGQGTDADTDGNRASIRENSQTDEIRDGESVRSDRAENDVNRESDQTQDHAAGNTSNQEDASDGGGENSSISISQTKWFMNTKARDLRARTQSTFQKWLRKGSSIFHISGKAGSGKSTLMKLIANDSRTEKYLEEWAGDKEIVTAQFFFWRAGSDTQRSRQGLYRSLLFETLKRCPHLIQDVFSESYRAFTKKNQENSIDKLFFRTEHIETAFRKLVSLSSSLGPRMCLFIDGLDEFGDDGVDSYEHENLAKSLITWTKNGDVKILASSRPYREYIDAFSENTRIHLHEVNVHDIQSFSRHIFEADDQFLLVKDHYEDLVIKITYESAGVFLWARLVARSLIVAIHRGDPVESLDNQLDATPKDITKLYEYFFSSISKADRERAFKILLLVAHCKFIQYTRFNALFLSWLELLEDQEFPMAYDMQPYTELEIQDRLIGVKRQIAGLTHGLLEMTSATGVESDSLFFDRNIQFFHRTARDFVLENPQLQRFHANHTSLTDGDMYLRLDIAELWFSKPGAIKPYYIHYCMGLKNNYSEQRPKAGRLEAVIKVRMYHNSDSSRPTFTARKRMFDRVLGFRDSYSLEPESHLHYILTMFRASDYLSEKTLQIDQLSKKVEISYILSASTDFSYGKRCNLENIEHLLNLGFSPMQQVLVHYKAEPDKSVISPESTNVHVTVWSIFIAKLIWLCYHYRPNDSSMDFMWKMLELFLQHGACENTFCLFKDSRASSTPTHVISLRELIQQLLPSNEKILLRLIDKNRTKTFRSRLKDKFSSIRSKASVNEFEPLRYAPFHIDMRVEPDKVAENVDVYGRRLDHYSLYSIWTDNHEMKVQGLNFRVY